MPGSTRHPCLDGNKVAIGASIARRVRNDGCTNWVASSRSLAEARPVILGSLVAYVLGLIVSLFRQFTDADIPPAAWLNVAIFAVFAGLYAYLQLGQSTTTGSPRAGSAA